VDAARRLGISVIDISVSTEPDEWERSFAGISKRPGTALTVLEDPMFVANSDRLAALCLRHRVPAVFPFQEHVEAGGLVSYGFNLRGLFRRAAHYVHKIVMGARPADLPIEQPTTLELVLNLKTAKALGLTIPPSLLARADQVIE
jgi:putative ABC transport system substrate-binding protein